MSTNVKKINNVEITIRTYDGKRVLTLPDFTNLFGMDNYRFTKKFNSMMKSKKIKIINSDDYYKLPAEVYQLYNKSKNAAHVNNGGYIITENGAKKLLCKEDEYISRYILDCYYNDNEPPKKETKIVEDKSTNNSTPTHKAETKETADLDKSFMLIANAYNNLAILQGEILKEIKAENDRFLKELKEILSTTATAAPDYIPDPPLDIEGQQDYQSFKKDISKAANKVLSKRPEFKSTNDVLSHAYKTLTKQYGVVWDQEKREFYKQLGRSPVNTLELEWWIERRPTYNGLLIGKLNTLYSKGKE